MIRILASLQNRIFVATALVAVLSIAFALRFVTTRVSGEAQAELERGLRRAGALMEENHAVRLETLTLLARLIADLPKLKAAVETNHAPTVEPLARDYRARVRADLFVVTGHEGGLLAAVGATPAALQGLATVPAAGVGAQAFTLRTEKGVVEVVTVPIPIGPDPPELVGNLSLGFALDDALAARVKAVTDAEVAFVVDGKVRASTLPELREADLAPVLSVDGIARVRLGGSEYVALRHRLWSGGGTDAPMAVILRSRTERLLFVRTLRTGLIVAALVAVLMAVLLSYAVARTVTHPLSALTATMREMTTTGDLARRMRRGRAWDDEDAKLLTGAFDSLTEAIARFQREASQRERLSALGRLSTVIAHEVRNPLMIIKSSLRTLSRDGASTQDVREATADIDHEVGRLNRIVDDVLDFARPVRLEYSPTDVNGLLRDALASVTPETAASGIVASLQSDLAPVLADGERLRTVIVNILSNALEATAATGDGPTPPVEVRSLGLRNGGVAIEVEDHGAGIDPADRPHVFEPYFTTKRTGTGLGLAIAKNIVDSHGGAISASATRGGGTRVRIELPASPRGAQR
jgi:signal transduction histidine kinase